jgi:hypothetical protein
MCINIGLSSKHVNNYNALLNNYSLYINYNLNIITMIVHIHNLLPIIQVWFGLLNFMLILTHFSQISGVDPPNQLTWITNLLLMKRLSNANANESVMTIYPTNIYMFPSSLIGHKT